jgi:hypothetical protein
LALKSKITLFSSKKTALCQPISLIGLGNLRTNIPRLHPNRAQSDRHDNI